MDSPLLHLARSILRLIGLTLILSLTVATYPVWVLTSSPMQRPQRRTRWFQFWCHRCAACMGVQIKSEGPIPVGGLIVSNHLSYLDIMVLSCVTPCVFVSKKEVRSWPVFGLVAYLLGTVFVDRGRAADLKAVITQMQQRLNEGVGIVLFPEGTTSNGAGLLPFFSSTLAAAQTSGQPVTPAALYYHLVGGRASEKVCYCDDATFGPHLWKLVGYPRIEARVRWGDPVPPQTDRKILTRLLQEKVQALHTPLT